VLDKYSAIISIDQVNWKEKYPYKPEVRVQIAHSNHYIWILANIKENHIKAHALKDYENVWEDSCFEFFVKFPNQAQYINFETNCIGISTAGLRTGRDDSTPISKGDLKKFVRISSLEQKLTNIPHFLSWNPINTSECNFHLPEFFGELALEKSEY